MVTSSLFADINALFSFSTTFCGGNLVPRFKVVTTGERDAVARIQCYGVSINQTSVPTGTSSLRASGPTTILTESLKAMTLIFVSRVALSGRIRRIGVPVRTI